MVGTTTNSRQKDEIEVLVIGGPDGIFVGWGYMGMPQEQFSAFLNEMFSAMGFFVPSTVHIEREENGRVNWSRIHISGKECEFHQVNARLAALAAARWLTEPATQDLYGRRFKVVTRS